MANPPLPPPPVRVSVDQLLAFTVDVLKRHIPRDPWHCSVPLCSCGSVLDLCPYRALARRHLYAVGSGERSDAGLPLGARIEQYEHRGWQEFFKGLFPEIEEAPTSTYPGVEMGETGSAAELTDEGPGPAALPLDGCGTDSGASACNALFDGCAEPGRNDATGAALRLS